MKLGKLIAHGKQDETEQSNNENDEQYDSGSDISSESGSCGTIEDINFATTCLMELGPCLEQNLKLAGSAQRRYSCLTSVPFTVSSPAMVYISSVREKFRQADYKLVERLGEANWQRHKAVREKIENTGLSLEERTKTGIACSLFRPYSDFHDSGIGSSVPAHIEYAPSHTSFQSSSIEADQGSLRVPREPSEVGAGKPFQCFLCNCIISNVRNRVDWKYVPVICVCLRGIEAKATLGCTYLQTYDHTFARFQTATMSSLNSLPGQHGPITNLLSIALTVFGIVQNARKGSLVPQTGSDTFGGCIDGYLPGHSSIWPEILHTRCN